MNLIKKKDVLQSPGAEYEWISKLNILFLPHIPANHKSRAATCNVHPTPFCSQGHTRRLDSQY